MKKVVYLTLMIVRFIWILAYLGVNILLMLLNYIKLAIIGLDERFISFLSDKLDRDINPIGLRKDEGSRSEGVFGCN
jgi:hypothetical protein